MNRALTIVAIVIVFVLVAFLGSYFASYFASFLAGGASTAMADAAVVQSGISDAALMLDTAVKNRTVLAVSADSAFDAFDFSYFLVLGIGFAGLVWMRRQVQSL